MTSMNTTRISSNSTSSQEPYTSVEIWMRSILYILLIVASVIGNLLIMVVVYSNKRMRTVTHYLIINNTMADLLITVIGMPITAREQILGKDTFSFGGHAGEVFCKIMSLTQEMSSTSSIFTLVAIAADRFCATFFPFKRLITMRRAKCVMVIIWLFSVVLGLPIAFVVNIALDPSNGEYYCTEQWSVFSSLGNIDELERAYSVFMFVLWYSVPLVVITILYSLMIKKVWKRKIPGQETAKAQDIQNKTKKTVLKMLISVVICFAICWLPYHLIFLCYSVFESPPLNLWLFANFMRYANSSITPWIYLIYSNDYRQGVQRILLLIICKKPPDIITLSRSTVNLGRMLASPKPNGDTIMLKTYTNTLCNGEDISS